VNGLPARVEGFAGLSSSLHLLPGKLRADVNGATMTLDADSEAGDDATLNLQLDDLGRWVVGARGQLTLQGRAGIQDRHLSISGTGSNLHFGEVEIPEASLKLDYGIAGSEMDLRLQAPTLRRGEYHLDNVEFAASGNPAQHQLQLQSRGRIAGRLQLDGETRQGQWQGILQPTELATSAGTWSLDQPVPLQWEAAQHTLKVAAHCWQHPEFTLCSAPLKMGSKGDIALQLQGDVSAFNGLLPVGLTARGTLHSQLQLAWNGSALSTLEGAARVTELEVERLFGLGERVSISWDSIDLSASRQGESLVVSADVVRQGRRVLAGEALLPATAQESLTGSVTLDSLQLVTFAPWVTELSTLQGAVSGRVALGGTAADPTATGSLQLQDGKLAVVGNPTELTGLNLVLQINGDSAQLQGQGLLGGGPVSLRGNIRAQPQLSLELAISGERHQILLPPASELLVSEELSLLLTGDLLDVGGEIHVHEGVLRQQELPEGSVGVSRDVVQVDLRGNVISEQRPFDLRADILLHVAERFRVEAEGLTATLGGELQLRQAPGKSLQVFGNLNLQGGELFVFRQHLQVSRGTVAFSGTPTNPELNIAAEREIRSEGVKVGARVTGPLEEPELQVYSDPVMSQGEAMSYLVRGRGLDAGAGGDGTALALSVGADIVNRSGIVAGINRLPLISNVAFGASGDADDTAATVSGYIGNRIYVSYGVGLYEPINVLTARLYLQSRLWLEVVSRLENSVDLYYSFDIR
jgi:autotransporter translocation and assembly factor TamB